MIPWRGTERGGAGSGDNPARDKHPKREIKLGKGERTRGKGSWSFPFPVSLSPLTEKDWYMISIFLDYTSREESRPAL